MTLKFRDDYKVLEREICANTTCPSNPIPVKLAKQCGGCLTEKCCSHQCQKTHWKHGHSHECLPPSSWLWVKATLKTDHHIRGANAAYGRFPAVFRAFGFVGCKVISGEEFLSGQSLSESDDEAKELVRT
ncbi:hypothetical protein C8J56DRAFT_900953 [Mycena floridula]|nr:hypothetical protein C8J56DRAFT_900953 [Mycena floridula]